MFSVVRRDHGGCQSVILDWFSGYKPTEPLAPSHPFVICRYRVGNLSHPTSNLRIIDHDMLFALFNQTQLL